MATPPAERKALLFSAGGVRLALRLSQVREIAPAEPGAGEARLRGGTVPLLPVAVTLGLQPGPGAFALVIEATSPLALRADALHGIVDLAEAEVFQLPARTVLPQPAPFAGAVVTKGEVALELALPVLVAGPLAPAGSVASPSLAPPADRELLFARAGRVYAAPIGLLVHVLEAARIFRVPLAPVAHRGLLYHGRTLHPVFDVAALFGGEAPAEGRTVLLLDAGGTQFGVVAERVLGVGEARAGSEVVRPAWDALFD
ncbi:MAG TPA: chemotaxis protein CheW [Anaeromyxobacteraceae bacterium]